jgi:hypothetical protein
MALILLNLYIEYLPPIILTTISIGFFAGLFENILCCKNNNCNGKIFFNTFISYISFGTIIGLIYPISIPLYSIYFVI